MRRLPFVNNERIYAAEPEKKEPLTLAGRSQKKERTFRNLMNLNVYENEKTILSQRMS
jgi:hypothetical protein